jgi:hypothetical protein
MPKLQFEGSWGEVCDAFEWWVISLISSASYTKQGVM